MLSKKEAKSYAYNLILEKRNCITKLTKEDKEILTALIIDSYDKFTGYEFMVEADTNSELPNMLSNYMKKGDSDSAQDLLDFMVDNAIKYAGNEIVDLLLEQEKEYEFNLIYDGDCDE